MKSIEAIASLDPWVASSLLQKAIRRSDTEFGVAAALRFHRLRGNSIWRRLMIVAHEDVGIGNLDLITDVTRLGIDPTARREIGTDQEVIVDLVRRLAAAPKDRSSDYLICTAIRHPRFEVDREAIAMLSDQERIAVAVDRTQPIISRAIATWYASGINGGGPQVVGAGDLPALIGAFEARCLTAGTAVQLELAARRTEEPITVMVPLLAALLTESEGSGEDERCSTPSSCASNGVPLYAFDKHTSLGKKAIARFAIENDRVERKLAEYVPDFRARAVAEMACFYADAIPIHRRLSWKLSRPLEALGLEVDMLKAGCPREGAMPIVNAVRANLDHLNSIRARMLGARARLNEGTFEVQEDS